MSIMAAGPRKEPLTREVPLFEEWEIKLILGVISTLGGVLVALSLYSSYRYTAILIGSALPVVTGIVYTAFKWRQKKQEIAAQREASRIQERLRQEVEQAYNKIKAQDLTKLELKHPIDAKGVYGPTLLHLAIADRNAALVRCLISKNADVNAEDDYGMTPLHVAIAYRDIPNALLLLDKGANSVVNKLDTGGKTPLHWAVESGDVELVKRLIKQGARNIGGKSGTTPLHLAAERGDLSIVMELAPRTQNPHAHDASRKSPLNYAQARGEERENYRKTIEYLNLSRYSA